MRNAVQIKNNKHLNVVTSQKSGLYKLRKLALKNRYQLHNGHNLRILTGLYRHQRNIAEMKTCQAVERYRQVMQAEIDVIFEAKEDRVLLFVHSLLKGKNIKNVDFTDLVSNADLKEISLLAGHKLSGILTGRFGITRISPMFKIELEALCNELALLEEWFMIKQRTVFISEQAAKWGNKAWGKAVNNVIAHEFLAEGLDRIDFASLLLTGLGVSPALEKEEMFDGLVRRVQGIVKNVKMRIVTELQAKGAEIIYGIHDDIVNRGLEEKISLLEARISEAEVYHIERA